jgi:hypothetical protein
MPYCLGARSAQLTFTIFARSNALCLGENFSCASASGTHKSLISITRNFIRSGLCFTLPFFTVIKASDSLSLVFLLPLDTASATGGTEAACCVLKRLRCGHACRGRRVARNDRRNMASNWRIRRTTASATNQREDDAKCRFYRVGLLTRESAGSAPDLIEVIILFEHIFFVSF